MRPAFPVALAFAILATPAHATIGLLCKPLRGEGPAVSLVFGAGADGGIAAVNLKEGPGWRSSYKKEDRLLLTRSSRDGAWIRANFLDARKPQRPGRLQVRISGYRAAGTLSFGGRSIAVRCVQD